MVTSIRAQTEADFDVVAAVHVRSIQASYAGLLPAAHLASLDPVVFAERRRSLHGRPGLHTLIAEQDLRIVGFASFGLDRDDPGPGELYSIYVDPGEWGTDAGWRLFAEARRILKDDCYPEMRLWVLAANERARRFYERAGMTTDGVPAPHRLLDAGIELPKLRYRARL
ncbi:GNAT family N-acetyltransferase [Actinoplanes regularis]|uniref:L-amino acid N-acyltransferase YncA n=1 Tax=Actinoplanes regularis TaxID=52697 RepID=A0A238V164_9ACTN|nr:GNAT family N-acetyltransferase [Actinoplanes regularis]GIE84196.1 N-acetyltransferase [Actinoplanes regularis]SNR27293.1 L-amino acid N-acyltransferase YncA [Actinoplanes regularis]